MKYGYDENDTILDETVEFTVKCRMRKRWAPQFVSMLRRDAVLRWYWSK